MDADEFFQIIQPGLKFQNLKDFVNSMPKHVTSLYFKTFFYAFEGNATKYIEKSAFPSFINDWLLAKDESKNRTPKSIHRVDATNYINIHQSITKGQVIEKVDVSKVILAHFRYPYKQYTLAGLNDGSYKRFDSFKIMFGNRVLKKLGEFGFDNYHDGNNEIKFKN